MTVNEFQERVGVGRACVALGRTGPTRQRTVVADDGPRRGNVAGVEVDHKDGRVDATVYAPTIQVTSKVQEL
jgi:hypothetical protein